MRLTRKHPPHRFDPRLVTLTAGLAMAAPAAAQAVSGDWFRHPALSPDGSTIVFCHGGDLYTVPSTGGRAIPLSIHSAYESMPVWSPDGSMIAFSSDRFGNDDVFVMPAQGGQATRLTHHSAADMPSDFSPDGKSVLFASARLDDVDSALFPSGVLAELYSVEIPDDGEPGTPSMVLTTPALNAVYNDAGDKILYEDRKGYEDELRKHHTSSIARDIWLYDAESGEHTKITTFDGEDREPEWGTKGMYYLSERSGDFNVWRKRLEANAQPEQLTRFENHPVRHLSRADDGLMAFSWHGDLYTFRAGQEPEKLGVTIAVDGRGSEPERVTKRGGATEFAIAPSGKEVAFIVRGEVFVTSVDFSTTVRITDTPEQERSVSFSPDGRSLMYAGERDGSWNIYETTLGDEDELYFFSATKMSEKAVVATEDDEFQPVYSYDGDRIAYLRERSELRVRDLKSGDEVVAAGGDTFYSYSDGDHSFEWSPDGEWLTLQHYSKGRVFYTEVGMVKADGSGGLVDLSKSGYDDSRPAFAMEGNAIIWATDRFGERSHGSWGAEYDVMAVFLNDDAHDRFRLSKEEYELKKELEEKKKEDEDEETDEDEESETSTDDAADSAEDDSADGDEDEKDEDEEEKAKPIEVDLDGLDDRKVRLTRHASDLGGYALSPDGDKLYYLARFEDGYDLWVRDIREESTKILVKLNASGAAMQMTDDGKHIFLLAGGSLSKVDTDSGKKEGISYAADMLVRGDAEREHMFEHVWRQTLKKFYRPDMQGVDWDYYREQYAPKVGGVNNNRDFANILSEFLGELNASHTGGRYRPGGEPGDASTASLGVFFDNAYGGDGMRIAEVIDGGPLDKSDLDIVAGDVITAIDGRPIGRGGNLAAALNNKAGDRVRLTVDHQSGETHDHVVKPISTGAENGLLYERWIEQRNEIVQEASDGRLGYAHVRGMNDSAFRAFYEKVMGEHYDKEALIVDTRFNGGGWLHDDLATFLTGKTYVNLYPRNDLAPGIEYHGDPATRWVKPSAVVMSESNYSDAHFFPWVYTELDIGPTIGMPVPGTATAVWWERMYTGDLIFGIPQVGTKGADGQYLENLELEPTYEVPLPPEEAAEGTDTQLLKAVEVLLEQLDG